MKNLFKDALERYKTEPILCNGCNEKRHRSLFKTTRKYCEGCPYVAELKKKYENDKPSEDVKGKRKNLIHNI